MFDRGKLLSVWLVSAIFAASVLVIAVAFIRWSNQRQMPIPELVQTTSVETPVASATPAGPEWSYSDSATGPERWGQLSSEFSTCEQGQAQSPINIQESVPTFEKLGLALDYPEQTVSLSVGSERYFGTFEPGGKMELGDEVFVLRSLKLHAPSEHAIEGRSFDMEMQLVHQNEQGEKAILAILFESGGPHAALGKLLTPLSSFPNVADREIQLDMSSLLPQSRAFYHYVGSETIPPCREGVRWIVLQETASVSFEQLERFLSTVGPNARQRQNREASVRSYN